MTESQFSKEGFLNGKVLTLDKPLNWTSFQLVNKIRWLIKQKYKLRKIKVGHAGTLDPLATGLMLICTGKATKTIPNLMGMRKGYTGEMTLGATTPSYDLETDIDNTYTYDHLDSRIIQKQTHALPASLCKNLRYFQL